MTQTHALHPHEHELKHADGSWAYTNALAGETSPYLLQHAHNPVDWHPWGEAAFDLARREGRPIFLSVGYSTCYWCHVMERLVFENPRIAALMNEHFVNIKVDREERPDVDDIYMLSVQALSGQGGWPMSVFLTAPGAEGGDDPGLKPFFAGTYYPPEPAHGRPSFPQLVEALSKAWREQRQEVIEQANEVTRRVRAHLGRRSEPGELTVNMVSDAANQLMRSYDARHGGFGEAPKFPQPAHLLFLLKVHENNPNERLWQAIAHTLDRMARGGMYDQIGGGFHRYSTDEQWLVPHFEKMLYDNGQLVQAYLYADRIRPSRDREADPAFYARVARQTCDYVLREMTDESGAFWSAQDAEVDAREGGNYVWTADEVRAAIDDESLVELALKVYGLDAGTNFRDPHDPDAQPVNVLYLPQRLDEVAADAGLSLDELLDRKARIDGRLMAARGERRQPGTDDKVLTSWNAMMISALAQAGMQLDEPRYTQAAARAAEAILTHMRDGDGGLLRTMRKGEAKIPAFLEDYAYMIAALVDLHHADGQRRWLEEAARLRNAATQRFGSQTHGGYFATLDDQRDLFVRTRSSYDGAIPAGNSQMAHALLDLHGATGEAMYLDRVFEDLRSFAGDLRSHGAGLTHMVHALLRAIEAAPQRVTAHAASADEQGARRQPVTMTLDKQKLDLTAGSDTLRITLRIHEEYHLNAHDPGQEGVTPTELRLEDGPGLALAVQYPDGAAREYAFADQPLNVYEGELVLTATVTRTDDAAGRTDPTLVLRYQVCTDQSCLEPREAEVPVVWEGLTA